MTLPNPGVSLSILQIYNEAQAYPSGTWYNRGTGLGAYRGVQWWKDNTETGFFPSGAISINDFYSKRPITPVTPDSRNITSSQNFGIPLYSNMTVVIRGGAGGGAGASGNIASGGNGFNGGGSSFWIYSAPPGSGGQINQVNGTNGAGSDGNPAGGPGGDAGGNGTNGGGGGAGGKTVVYLTNPISGGNGPSVGSVVFVGVGGGGGGGPGGQFFNGYYVLNMPNGSSGGQGSVQIYWS